MYTVPEILTYVKANGLTYYPGHNWEHFTDLTPEQAAGLKAICTAHNVQCDLMPDTNGARVHHYADPDYSELLQLVKAAMNQKEE